MGFFLTQNTCSKTNKEPSSTDMNTASHGKSLLYNGSKVVLWMKTSLSPLKTSTTVSYHHSTIGIIIPSTTQLVSKQANLHSCNSPDNLPTRKKHKFLSYCFSGIVNYSKKNANMLPPKYSFCFWCCLSFPV